jgi:excisionase family DNA binding protein
MAPGDPQRRSSQTLLLSVSQTAALLGIHRATVYDLLASGELRSTTLGRRRVIPRAAVEAFVAMLDQRAEQEAARQRASR